MSTGARKRITKKKAPEPEQPVQRTASEITADDITIRLQEIKEILDPIDEQLSMYELAISDISAEIEELNDNLDEETDIRKRNKLSNRLEILSNKLVELENYKDVLEQNAKPRVDEKRRLLEQLEGNPGLLNKALQKAKETAEKASMYVADILKPDGTVKYKNAFVASRAIDSIATGKNLSIFDTYDNIIQGSTVTRDQSKYIDTNDNTLTIDCTGDPPQFRSELIEAVENGNPPLVILVTSKIHAIIYIIHEGNKYTVGYGYNGSGDESLKANKLANKVRTSSKSYAKKIKDPLAHMIEYLPGALYTADYLVPEDDNIARISWITFLDVNIITEIQDMLYHANEIVYNIKNNIVSDQAIVNLDQNYSEAIQIMKPLGFLNGYNCIVWAEKVLGVNGLCGAISNPNTCPSVTQQEWKDVIKNMSNIEGLVPIIQDIVCRLKPDFCTSIMRTLRLKGGKKTRKNKKTNNRRKRYNKTRK